MQNWQNWKFRKEKYIAKMGPRNLIRNVIAESNLPHQNLSKRICKGVIDAIITTKNGPTLIYPVMSMNKSSNRFFPLRIEKYVEITSNIFLDFDLRELWSVGIMPGHITLKWNVCGVNEGGFDDDFLGWWMIAMLHVFVLFFSPKKICVLCFCNRVVWNPNLGFTLCDRTHKR